jgi:DNA-binding GntR family transcriptional regulator
MNTSNLKSWENEILINRASNRPLYIQVKEGLEIWILARLRDGSLSSGDRLPSENELSETLKISNITIKRSLDELRRQGLIQRIQGRGSFVTGQNKLTFDLPRMFNLTAYTEESGRRPTRKILEMSEQVATPAIAKQLNLSARSRVIRLVRLRLVDQIPAAVDTSYLPWKPFHDLIHIYNDSLSLYEVMTQRYGCEVVKTHDILMPVLIKPFESRALEVPVGTLGVMIERIGFDVNDRPLEFTNMIFRGDKCSFSIDYSKENNGK